MRSWGPSLRWRGYIGQPETDDNEFYIPQIERCVDLKEFYFRALRWQFMYNTRRYHSTPGMTPYRKLRTEMQISKQVALFPVIQLEKLTDLYQKLFPSLDTMYLPTTKILSGTDMVSRVRAVSGGSVVVGQLLGWVLKKPRD